MDPQQSTSPPTKASLKAWWKGFQRKRQDVAGRAKSPSESSTGSAVFGAPLRESLRYASVPISTANGPGGKTYIYGYVPIVVAKCGLFLKENATEVEGTFRVNGSAKRMRELQTQFETPPKYGKHLDWKKENYTSHDVASVFRRYLTQMPEPVIPHNLYHEFRDAYAQARPDIEKVVLQFQELVKRIPRSNQYLLLYVLDLLSVFARKSDVNLMTATNLAVIFRPGVLSHPSQELSPEQHQLSQDVVEFMIEHQDRFLLDIPPPPRTDSILLSHNFAKDTIPDEDYYMEPSDSDEDIPPEGGWKVVDNRQKSHALSPTTSHPHSPTADVFANNNVTVKRSVTVPSKKSKKVFQDSKRGGRMDAISPTSLSRSASEKRKVEQPAPAPQPVPTA